MASIGLRLVGASAFATLLWVAMASPASAVVTNVQILAGGVPQTASSISVFGSQQPAAGESPIATGRTDAAGVARLDFPPQYGSDDGRRRCLLLVARDSEGRETGRIPCFYFPSSGGGVVADTRTGQVGPRDISVVRQDRRAKAMGPLTFGLSYSYTVGTVDTRVTRNNTGTEGAAIDVTTPALRGDVRWSPPQLGNIGNFGNLGPSDCYLGLQGAVGLDDGDTGLNSDQHPTPTDGQVDTTLKREFKGSVTPMVGCTMAKLPNGGGRLDLQAGPRISFMNWTLTTDETAGAGQVERIQKSETTVGAAVGIEYNLPLGGLGMGNLGNLGRPRGGLRAGVWGEYMPGSDVSLMSSTFGFNYRAEAESSWLWTFLVGGYLSF